MALAAITSEDLGNAVGVVILIAVAAALYLSTRRDRRIERPDKGLRRKLARRKAVPSTSVSEGQRAKFQGIVRRCEGEPLRAPMSGRPCVFYQMWTGISHPESFSDFRFQKLPGECAGRVEWQSTLSRKRSPELDALQERCGHASEHESVAQRRDYRETIIAEGAFVSVFGRCHLEPDPNPSAQRGYREMPQRVRLVGSAREPVLVSDAADAIG
ncbi:hypothetical protein Hoch_4541 [Haliangium ochraceum DSM 14365]|uniref:Uncharacterized protein n=1 Tax=Haliangium ochraceum (strain DSM 14365 / JCM 11303 / SMP-2) TaxID=502025 RepID=D0LPZ6_HALO1|nr:hypothetical protein Hoch_4541 [Haliangium ochraceum DSM 14365]